ncbi:MAG TPA: DUF4234 domain-containing protein [Pyrodictiaceae archaeon]|nr:DUF4234 domain-containing protein [Pyrodictiaceae archaeon]
MNSNLSGRVVTLLNELKSYHVRASETDRIIPIWLPYISIVLTLIAILIGGITIIAGDILIGIGLTTFAIIAGIAGAIIFILVLYKLINRLNKHSERTIMFYSIIANILDEIRSPNATNFKLRVDELKVTTKERNPLLWIILVLIFPLLLFYVYHFLNKDFYKHSYREYLLLDILDNEFKRANISTVLNPEELYRVPSRNTILFIILTIITLGFFKLYWTYTLVNDPNKHFKSHSILEKKIIDGFTEMISKLKEAS